MKTSRTAPDSTGSPKARNWIPLLNTLCAVHPSGMRSRTDCAKRPFHSPGGSSNGCASLARWQNEPDVLLLDEPGSALDPANTQRIEELLYELKRDLSIVIVTHNLQQAARVSDNTVFLYQGALVEMNATRDLFTSPREPQNRSVYHREIWLMTGTAGGYRHFHDELATLKQRLLAMSERAEIVGGIVHGGAVRTGSQQGAGRHRRGP